jgi:ribosomal protein S18 acetylase RimI-like enzyme
MEIVFANETHIPAMLRLPGQVGQVHHEIRPDIFPAGMMKYDAAALKTLLQDSQKPILIAQENGAVLGYCFCQIRPSGADKRQKELYIDDLCVEECCRGQKVGTALLDYAVSYGKQQGCRFLTLNVWCGNDGAMRFYENAGLTPRHIMMETKL